MHARFVIGDGLVSDVYFGGTGGCWKIPTVCAVDLEYPDCVGWYLEFTQGLNAVSELYSTCLLYTSDAADEMD